MSNKKDAAARGSQEPVAVPGQFAYSGLDRVLHEKARLGIMTSLARYSQGCSFADLKELCALSDGNLNRHLSVLQEAELIEIEKDGAGRGSKTHCRLTSRGRSAFQSYLAELERVLADAAALRQGKGVSARELRWDG